jgi:hypothetical protein
VREELEKCQKGEGVNHYENCKWLSDKYLKMMKENRVSWVVVSWNFVFADGTYPSLRRRCKVTSGSSYRGLGSCLQYHRFVEIALNMLKACQTPFQEAVFILWYFSRNTYHIGDFAHDHPNHHTALGSQEVPKLRDMFTTQLSITPNSPFFITRWR